MLCVVMALKHVVVLSAFWHPKSEQNELESVRALRTSQTKRPKAGH